MCTLDGFIQCSWARCLVWLNGEIKWIKQVFVHVFTKSWTNHWEYCRWIAQNLGAKQDQGWTVQSQSYHQGSCALWKQQWSPCFIEIQHHQDWRVKIDNTNPQPNWKQQSPQVFQEAPAEKFGISLTQSITWLVNTATSISLVFIIEEIVPWSLCCRIWWDQCYYILQNLSSLGILPPYYTRFPYLFNFLFGNIFTPCFSVYLQG